MKLLLDTHVWLWGKAEPSRIRPALVRILSQPDTRLWLSPISIWETGMLLRKRRFTLPQGLEALVEETLHTGRIEVAPVTAEVAVEVNRLRLPYNDPADNLLAATARVYGLVLATADRRLLGVRGPDCIRA